MVRGLQREGNRLGRHLMDAQPQMSRSRNQTPSTAVHPWGPEYSCKVTMSSWCPPRAGWEKCLIKHCGGVRTASKRRAGNTHHFFCCYGTDGCVVACVFKGIDHQRGTGIKAAGSVHRWTYRLNLEGLQEGTKHSSGCKTSCRSPTKSNGELEARVQPWCTP